MNVVVVNLLIGKSMSLAFQNTPSFEHFGINKNLSRIQIHKFKAKLHNNFENISHVSKIMWQNRTLNDKAFIIILYNTYFSQRCLLKMLLFEGSKPCHSSHLSFVFITCNINIYFYSGNSMLQKMERIFLEFPTKKWKLGENLFVIFQKHNQLWLLERNF